MNQIYTSKARVFRGVQLAAKTSFELGPEGVRCTIELPLFSQINDIFDDV